MISDIPPMVNVRTPKGTQAFVQSDWETFLDMGRLYGWQPMGTLPATDSPDDRCDGAYFPAKGQRIQAEDSYALAEALRRAHDDIPEKQGEALPAHAAGYINARATMEYYAGPKKRLLLRFIEMCKAGELRLFREGPAWHSSP